MNDKENKKNIEVEDEIEFEPSDEVKKENKKSDKLTSLKEKLKQCQKERQEYLDGWQRSKADFINARKDETERRDLLVKFAEENLLKEILIVSDSFESAFSSKDWEKLSKEWQGGIKNIFNSLSTTKIDRASHILAQFNLAE